MTSYRRYATRQEAVDRAWRQIQRHKQESYTEPKGSEPSLSDLCRCGHPRANHHWHAARGEGCIGNRNLCSCRMFRAKPAPPGAEPPMMPEEEEQAPPDEPYRDCLTHIAGACVGNTRDCVTPDRAT